MQHSDIVTELHGVQIENAKLRKLLDVYKWSSFGVLTPPALRYELAQLIGPLDLVVWDWRKLHEWNEVLGWDVSGAFLRRAATYDFAGPERRHHTRHIDVRGQWGVDEIVWAVDAGDGRGLLARLVRELRTLTNELTPAQRDDIYTRTGGLIDGFCISAILIEGSIRPLMDTERAVPAANRLKLGRQTGSRATSGTAGSVFGRMEALA